MPIKIYGSSDDLIEIEGDINEEFNLETWAGHASKFLGFSDGTLLRAVYDSDGIWRLTKLITGAALFAKREGDFKSGTDEVTLFGAKITWVVGGGQSAITSIGKTNETATPD